MRVRLRIVLDTNIFISAFLFRGKPALVLDAVFYGDVDLVYSAAIQEEIERVLSRKFGWPAAAVDAACDVYWKRGILVTPDRSIHDCPDADDNRILECAVEGGAHFIVTGDKDLLRMARFGEIAIVTALEFLAQIAPQSG